MAVKEQSETSKPTTYLVLVTQVLIFSIAVLALFVFLTSSSSSRYGLYYFPSSGNGTLRTVLVILYAIFEVYFGLTLLSLSATGFYGTLSLTYIHITYKELKALRYDVVT
jgi:hypothetical protein